MKKQFHKWLPFLLGTLCLLFFLDAISQDTEDLMSMSLDDILNMQIFSASKKVEDLFDSPLSSSVITREEIENSGITSIPEALRLVPGMIVREETNGIYDIHVRGLGNVPPNRRFTDAINSITLVMVDNRIVYNYLDGGTFWETIPVDLNDVDRIEVVRGPAAALYGPNAVAGVINIITRKPAENGIHAVANVQGGSYRTQIANGTVGYKTDKFGLLVSGNMQKRDRYTDSYYVSEKGEYISFENMPESIMALDIGRPITGLDERFPKPGLAMDKKGANVFLHYAPSDALQFDISSGFSESRVQNIYVDMGATAFATRDSKSKYVNFSGIMHGFSTRFSMTNGEEYTVNPTNEPNEYNSLDAEVEYEFDFAGLSLRPGLSLKNVVYDWVGMGGEKSLQTIGFSLRADYQWKKLRLVAGIRGDKYDTPDKMYPSYQLSALYHLNEKHLIRAVASRANRAAFLAHMFFDMDIPIRPAGIGYAFYGNPELKLMRMDMVEFGYRGKWSDKIQLDIEAFLARTKDYDELFPTGEVEMRDGLMYFIERFQNLSIQAQQKGITASLNYVPNSKLFLKTFVTLQTTDLIDYVPELVSQPDSLVNQKHEHSPSYYGGLIVNFKPFRKLNSNVSVTYYGKQVFDHEDYSVSLPFPPFTTTDYPQNMDIKAKVILNLAVSYSLTPQLTLFANGRNLLGADTVEYGFAETIGTLYLAGLRINY